jgi:hypothetical protein
MTGGREGGREGGRDEGHVEEMSRPAGYRVSRMIKGGRLE